MLKCTPNGLASINTKTESPSTLVRHLLHLKLAEQCLMLIK